MFRYIRQQGARWLLLLAVADYVLLACSLMLATHVRFWPHPDDLASHSEFLLARAAVFAVVMIGALAALGLYQPRLRENWTGLFARQCVGFLVGGSAVALLFYILPQAYVGRGLLGLALVIGFMLLTLSHMAFARLVDVEALKRRVLVLGSGRQAAVITQRMRRRVDRRGFHLVGFLPMPGEAAVVPADRLLACSEPLPAFVERMQINEIVIGPEDRRGSLPMDELLECRQAGIAVTSLATFFERELGTIKLNLVDPSWLVFSDGFDASPLRRFSKRAFDIVAALLVLALAWPLMLAAVLAIRLESGRGAPILYRQERVGERAHGIAFARSPKCAQDRGAVRGVERDELFQRRIHRARDRRVRIIEIARDRDREKAEPAEHRQSRLRRGDGDGERRRQEIERLAALP